ncbi:MAG: nickel-dependent lactate racemase [Christensenellales bacterium]|jgi:nickel-dependent lactate racemase
MIVSIPYADTHLPLEIDESLDVQVLESRAHRLKPHKDEDEIVREAMASPIGTPALFDLAKGRKNAVIICSDHTRPVPSRKIVPHMLRELRAANADMDITLLIATGCHRATTKEELLKKFGQQIVRDEKIVVHDCDDESMLTELGTMPSGAVLKINRLAAQTDLLLAEGFIEPHFFAGYSGGRKSVMPGIAARLTVLGNHSAGFVAHPNARSGILRENPMHEDMIAAAKMARLTFIVNVVINRDKKVVAAFAGDSHQAHLAGCRYLDGVCRVKAEKPADIVVTSNGGAPLDQNIYQAVKCMATAENVAARDAIIIAVSACNLGTGSDEFYRALKDGASPRAVLEHILKVPMDSTRIDQWQTQVLARILAHHQVVLVCEEESRRLAEDMKMTASGSLQQAFDEALRQKGRSARIAVLPDGVAVVSGL